MNIPCLFGMEDKNTKTNMGENQEKSPIQEIPQVPERPEKKEDHALKTAREKRRDILATIRKAKDEKERGEATMRAAELLQPLASEIKKPEQKPETKKAENPRLENPEEIERKTLEIDKKLRIDERFNIFEREKKDAKKSLETLHLTPDQLEMMKALAGSAFSELTTTVPEWRKEFARDLALKGVSEHDPISDEMVNQYIDFLAKKIIPWARDKKRGISLEQEKDERDLSKSLHHITTQGIVSKEDLTKPAKTKTLKKEQIERIRLEHEINAAVYAKYPQEQIADFYLFNGKDKIQEFRASFLKEFEDRQIPNAKEKAEALFKEHDKRWRAYRERWHADERKKKDFDFVEGLARQDQKTFQIFLRSSNGDHDAIQELMKDEKARLILQKHLKETKDLDQRSKGLDFENPPTTLDEQLKEADALRDKLKIDDRTQQAFRHYLSRNPDSAPILLQCVGENEEGGKKILEVMRNMEYRYDIEIQKKDQTFSLMLAPQGREGIIKTEYVLHDTDRTKKGLETLIVPLFSSENLVGSVYEVSPDKMERIDTLQRFANGLLENMPHASEKFLALKPERFLDSQTETFLEEIAREILGLEKNDRLRSSEKMIDFLGLLHQQCEQKEKENSPEADFDKAAENEFSAFKDALRQWIVQGRKKADLRTIASLNGDLIPLDENPPPQHSILSRRHGVLRFPVLVP